jgi:HD domain
MARQGSRAQGSERVRTAELIAALCLATDLGMAFPFEHGLHTTLIAMRLANKLGIDQQSASQTYYGCLLCHASCTTEAHVAAEVFGGSLTTNINPVMYGSAREILTGMLRALPDPGSPAPLRAVQTARRLPRAARQLRPALSAGCEVAGRLAEQVGAPPSVPGLLAHLTERWDGKGPLRRAKGEQIPLPMRIVHVATDAALQWRVGGVEHAVRLMGERAGHAFDPQVAACVVDGGGEILALDDSASVWERSWPWSRPHRWCWSQRRSIARLGRWGTSPTWSRRPLPATPAASRSWRLRRPGTAGSRRWGWRRSGGPGWFTTLAGWRPIRGSGRSPGR